MHVDTDRRDDLPEALAGTEGRSGPRDLILKRLLGSLAAGRLAIVTPEQRRLAGRGAAPGPDATLVLHRWRALRRLLTGGDVGFSEAYVAGDWSSPDLAALVELAALNVPQLEARLAALLPLRLWNRLRHALRGNSPDGSRRNIAFHYDLGNAFYRLWLDRSMSYSSALYEAPGQSLEEAQAAKIRRVLALMDVRSGDTVLEIGCGWGGLAAALARRGADVTGLTLSREQLAYGTAMLAGEGLDGRARLRFQDYREAEGRYDRIVSIEMLEAVGERYWPIYFRKVRECLKHGGTAVLQVITIAEDRFEGYRRNTDFIQRHIFPGGMLPTKALIATHARRAGLDLVGLESFGASYALTLAEWRRRFGAARRDIDRLGFGEEFRRLWDYYLGYCEGGFRARAIDVGFYTLRG